LRSGDNLIINQKSMCSSIFLKSFTSDPILWQTLSLGQFFFGKQVDASLGERRMAGLVLGKQAGDKFPGPGQAAG
jgi:hypothetical protein